MSNILSEVTVQLFNLLMDKWKTKILEKKLLNPLNLIFKGIVEKFRVRPSIMFLIILKHNFHFTSDIPDSQWYPLKFNLRWRRYRRFFIPEKC